MTKKKARQIVEIPHLEIIAEQEFADVELDKLVCTDEYQRGFSQAKADNMAKDFHPLAARELVLSVREDGRKIIVDGRHTRVALQLCGYTKWRAQLLYGLTLAEEARLFWYLNTKRANPRAIETWRSRQTFHDPVVEAVESCCEAAGFTVGKTVGVGKTKSVAAIERIYEVDGSDGLVAVLDLAITAWSEDPRHSEGKLFLGIATFLRGTQLPSCRYGEVADKWKKTSLDTILHRAKSMQQFEGASSTYAMGCSLLDAYNKGRRSGRLKFKSNGRDE